MPTNNENKQHDPSTPITPEGENYGKIPPEEKEPSLLDQKLVAAQTLSEAELPETMLPKKELPKAATALMLEKFKTQQKNKIIAIVIIALVLIICLCFTISTFSGGDSDNPNLSQTTFPTATRLPVTIEPSATKVPLISPTPRISAEWPIYVLSGCNLRVRVPEDWKANRVGDFGACGSYRSLDQEFTNFDTYPGVMLFVVPMANESVFWDKAQNSISSYLSSLEKDLTRETGNKDFFVSENEVIFQTQVVPKVEIKRRITGTSTNLFYTSFGKSYVIIWGGQSLEGDLQEINEIIDSAEFLQPA